MNPQLLSLGIFLGLLLLLISITELLYRRLKLSADVSRKFLHVSGGLFCLLLPMFFSSHWWVLTLASLSFLLLLITYYNNMLHSIHKTKRYSIGSIIFPIPVYFCFLIADQVDNDLFFYLPISLLTISDTAAETAGKRWGYLSMQFFKGQKTLAGAIAFFLTAMLVSIAWLYFFNYPTQQIAIFTIILSLSASLMELVTLKGWDNLTVPMISVLILWLLL